MHLPKWMILAGAMLCGATLFPQQDEFTQELNTYVGKALILRFYGNREKVAVKRKDLGFPTETCDRAVEIREASYRKNKIVFKLEQIGNIRIGGASRCFNSWNETEFAITDIGELSSRDFASMLRDVLLTPEEYLEKNGRPFTLQPSEDAGFAGIPDAGTIPPKPVLQIDPAYTEEARRHRAMGHVRVSAVVGTDGRIHTSQILSHPGYGLDKQALRVLPLWRFEPARRMDKAVAFLMQLEFSFALY